MKINTSTSIRPANKTVAIFGDDKGGITKTASCANVADGLRQFGYNIQLVDGDNASATLSELDPRADRIDLFDESALDQLFSSIASSESDLVMLDTPSSAGKVLSSYFKSRGFETFQEMGIRIVVAMVITETDDAAKGVISWIEAFFDKAEFMLVANNRDTPDGKYFQIEKITAGDTLLEIAENRCIHIPKFSNYMRAQYNINKGLPSEYLQGGRVAAKLRLNALHSSLWAGHLKQVVSSVEPYVEWITGKKPPQKPKYTVEEQTKSDPGKSLLQTFKSKVEERMREKAK